LRVGLRLKCATQQRSIAVQAQVTCIRCFRYSNIFLFFSAILNRLQQ